MSFASLGISYEEFIKKYLNKRNSSGMYWSMADVSVATGTDIEVLYNYLRRAQKINYDIVVKTGKSATEAQLLEA